METNKVVARFKNGTVKKGTTSDFFPNKRKFRLNLLNGEVLKVKIEELKAIYFVKDFEGDMQYTNMYNNDVPGENKKIQVTFFDGEMLIGYTQDYSPTHSGFFVTPADPRNNNKHIYVITSATEKVYFCNTESVLT